MNALPIILFSLNPGLSPIAISLISIVNELPVIFAGETDKPYCKLPVALIIASGTNCRNAKEIYHCGELYSASVSILRLSISTTLN